MVDGVRLDVKTISFPTLRHFQPGSPNTDRRLFQSALATGASPLSPPFPFHPSSSYPAAPKTRYYNSTSTSVRRRYESYHPGLARHARKARRNFHIQRQLSISTRCSEYLLRSAVFQICSHATRANIDPSTSWARLQRLREWEIKFQQCRIVDVIVILRSYSELSKSKKTTCVGSWDDSRDIFQVFRWLSRE